MKKISIFWGEAQSLPDPSLPLYHPCGVSKKKSLTYTLIAAALHLAGSELRLL
jgi:hypothetical protein